MSKSTSRYRFVTEWTLDAPIEAVWTELSHPEGWPSWWRGVVAVDLLEPGDGAGLGARRRLTFRSVLPYHLVFTMRTDRLERPALIEGRADGELRGIGRWCLRSTSAGTAVRYTWTVEAMKPWMRWLAPVSRPLFQMESRRGDAVGARGAAAEARRVWATALSCMTGDGRRPSRPPA